MKPIRKLLLAFIVLALATINERVQGQVTWTLSQTVSQVDCYYSLTVCDGKSAVFLKFVNNNAQSVTISWDEVFSTQMRTNAPGNPGAKQLFLPPGTTAPSGCADTGLPACIILGGDVSPTYVADISAFNFVNVSVQ
jgi:hypothetical protein